MLRIWGGNYQKFKYKNASTDDFKEVCEETSGRNLDQFFKQWVFVGNNIPSVDYNWQSESEAGKYKVTLRLEQTEKGYNNYDLPIEFSFKSESGETKLEKVRLNEVSDTYRFSLDFAPLEVIPDPDNHLLVYFSLNKE